MSKKNHSYFGQFYFLSFEYFIMSTIYENPFNIHLLEVQTHISLTSNICAKSFFVNCNVFSLAYQ